MYLKAFSRISVGILFALISGSSLAAPMWEKLLSFKDPQSGLEYLVTVDLDPARLVAWDANIHQQIYGAGNMPLYVEISAPVLGLVKAAVVRDYNFSKFEFVNIGNVHFLLDYTLYFSVVDTHGHLKTYRIVSRLGTVDAADLISGQGHIPLHQVSLFRAFELYPHTHVRLAGQPIASPTVGAYTLNGSLLPASAHLGHHDNALKFDANERAAKLRDMEKRGACRVANLKSLGQMPPPPTEFMAELDTKREAIIFDIESNNPNSKGKGKNALLQFVEIFEVESEADPNAKVYWARVSFEIRSGNVQAFKNFSIQEFLVRLDGARSEWHALTKSDAGCVGRVKVIF